MNSSNWKIGDVVQGRWEVHRILQGGMGVVFIVYDREWREAFAAKTFQDEVFARNPNIKDRFEKEALAWVNLDLHENITEARLLHVIGGKPFLFLEYVSGGDLGPWIGTPRLTDDLPQVLRFSIQFCDGMQHVASKGIKAHRDIKPQNCLITSSGVLKITDFGLAKVFDDALPWGEGDSSAGHLSVGLSQTGTAAGTWTHMSPEQFEDAKRVDVRADIYSFGVMLFQMVTGELPFMGRTFMEFAALHMRGTPPIHKISNHRVRSVIEKCLRKNSRDRYQDFDQLRRDLASLYEAQTGLRVPKPMAGDELTAFHLVNKGNSLGKLGRADDSLACFDRAISLNPSLAEAWLNKGASHFEVGQHAEALDCFGRALALKPSFAVAWSNKGQVMLELERHDEALACFQEAHKLGDATAARFVEQCRTLLHLDRGRAAYQAGNYEEAIRYCEAALAIDATNIDAWTNRGAALMGMGRSSDAIASFEKAISINPEMVSAWNSKGRVLENLGQLREAIAAFDGALTANPDYAQAWFSKAAVLAKLQQHADAVSCYESGLKLDSGNAPAWFNMGHSIGFLGRHQDVVKCCDRALEIHRDFSPLWILKGLGFVSMERFQDAMNCFQQAEKLGDTTAAGHIARCHNKLGKR